VSDENIISCCFYLETQVGTACALESTATTHIFDARSGRGTSKAKDAQMKHRTILYRSAALAIATAALIGNLALADELPQSDADETSSNIVLAKAKKTGNQAEKFQVTIASDADEAGVTEAMEHVLADSKTELEIRLSGHKSLILNADL
jgi:hypothetical protein